MTTRVLPRGNWQDESGAVVEPAVPHFLTQPESKGGSARLNRLDLARWLVAPENPLTARVYVNRVWKHHFGSALVDTTSDFGAQGSRPSHPALLDDLAGRFIANGWSLKWLHREIVLSATYRQSAKSTPEQLAKQRELMRAFEKRVLDTEAHEIFLLWRYRIVPYRSYVKGGKISPSHYVNQDLATIWLDR